MFKNIIWFKHYRTRCYSIMSRARKLRGLPPIDETDISPEGSRESLTTPTKPITLASIDITLPSSKPLSPLIPTSSISISSESKLSKLKEFGRARRRNVTPETIKSVQNNIFHKPKSVMHHDVLTSSQSLSGINYDDRSSGVDLEKTNSLPSSKLNAMMLPKFSDENLILRKEVGGFHQREPMDLESNELMEQRSSSIQEAGVVKKKINFNPMDIRPAGIEVKLPKVIGKFVQPQNPKLLKVAVLGVPNAGKSTLLNALIGETISIVSEKAHTTRERILMVLTEGDKQIIFLDTPGTVTGRNKERFNRVLVNASWQSLLEVDHVLAIVDSQRAEYKSTYNESCLFNRLRDYELPSTLVLNKVDLLPQPSRENVLRCLEEKFKRQYPFFKEIVCVSALEKQGLDKLKENLFSHSYDSGWMYPAEVKTEMADLKRVEDLIRVELLVNLRSYLSYSVKQENEGWSLLSDGTLRIDQTLYVERESQQRIVIGKEGKTIKLITKKANKAMVNTFKRPIRLYLTCKIKNTKNIRSL